MSGPVPAKPPFADIERASRLAAACLLILTAASPVAAQAPSSSPSPTGFLTRYDVHLSGEALSSPSPGFSWVVDFGGDLDLCDYGAGRLALAADYEAVLSDEVRLFEPVQGNYTLEASTSYRTSLGEFAFVLHHLSRHLVDRPQEIPVDWNTIGVRFERRITAGSSRVLTRAAAARVFRFRYVDYSWLADADLRFDRALRPNVGLFARGAGHVFGVDSVVVGRGTQLGGRIEAGVRLGGREGALELFAGYERRVDAEVMGRTPLGWALVGLRLVNH